MDMNRSTGFFADILQRLEKMDKDRFFKELRELFYFINRQVLNQIPGVSAIGAILVGAWVSSTFTTSEIKGRLASLGLIEGGTHVVSSATFRLLSVFLPILAAGLTAYLIQKTLKSYRQDQLDRNMVRATRLGEEVKAELQGKLALLEKVKEAGILSAGEYYAKKANLYQAYSRALPSKIEEFIIRKLTS